MIDVLAEPVVLALLGAALLLYGRYVAPLAIGALETRER